jgi:aminoglycoside 6'-N-acetyltransferase
LGYVQRYRLDDHPDWREVVAVGVHAIDGVGIDYLIGNESMTGQGLGPKMISEFVDATWPEYGDISAVVVAVQQANRASWRALERAGFQRQWKGLLVTDDLSDQGPAYLYVRYRPTG